MIKRKNKDKKGNQINIKNVKVPTILQMEAVECGAAALAMILAYYGRWVPLEIMRVEIGVNRDGSKASNMVRAARKYGMTAQGYRLEPRDIQKYKLPVIVFWNFNHFVILTGIQKNKVYINDPKSGPRVITYEEFDKSFTGVVLTFEPGEDFVKGGKKPSVLRSLKNRISNTKLVLTYVILAGLFLVVPGLLIPTFTRIFVDRILIHEMKSWIVPLITFMVVTALVQGGLIWLQSYYLLKLNMQLSLSNSARFFYHVFRLPIQFFFQRQAGEVSNRIQLNDKVAKLLSEDLTKNVLNVAMIIFYAVVMFFYDVILTLVGISIVAVNFIGLKYISEKRKVINQKMNQERGKLTGISMNGIELVETLKASGSEDDFYARWAGSQAKLLNTEQEQGLISRLLSQLPRFLTNINRVIIFGLGGYRVVQGSLTLGMLLAFKWLMDSFVRPVEGLVNAGSKIQDAAGYMRRLDDVYDHDRDELISAAPDDDNPGKVKLEGYLELKNVTFGYSILEKPLIENFSLSLKPGERVALVGASGSGKSTVAKLVAGLYKEWEGQILFDGRERTAYSRELLNNSLAMVDQDIFLFEGSVMQNVSMWDTTITEMDIIKAAGDAAIHGDISARKSGYKSKVNERGANFSGGQRQRLEIARALAINPSILVFDEATSALDPTTEKLIDDYTRRRGCTMLIIAHRLSTIRDCDEIIVLDKGQVVQRGIHEKLMKEGGEYAALISSE